MRADTLGVVLAGGLARRMGGGDKPLRLLGGRPMLDQALDRLAPQVAAVIVNANGDPARFAAHRLPVVADGLPDHPGPLAGVLAALDWAAAHRPDLPLRGDRAATGSDGTQAARGWQRVGDQAFGKKARAAEILWQAKRNSRTRGD